MHPVLKIKPDAPGRVALLSIFLLFTMMTGLDSQRISPALARRAQAYDAGRVGICTLAAMPGSGTLPTRSPSMALPDPRALLLRKDRNGEWQVASQDPPGTGPANQQLQTEPESPDSQIYLYPFSGREAAKSFSLPFSQDLVDGMKERFPPFRFKVMEPLSPPDEGYDFERDQYLASPFLRLLEEKQTALAGILGITHLDLYAPRSNFIFGQAWPGTRVAVISVARLNPKFFSQPADDRLFFRRILTEAVHELGHLFDLPHCSRSSCVMHFSNTLRDTDRKAPDFCDRCKKRLSRSWEKRKDTTGRP